MRIAPSPQSGPSSPCTQKQKRGHRPVGHIARASRKKLGPTFWSASPTQRITGNYPPSGALRAHRLQKCPRHHRPDIPKAANNRMWHKPSRHRRGSPLRTSGRWLLKSFRPRPSHIFSCIRVFRPTCCQTSEQRRWHWWRRGVARPRNSRTPNSGSSKHARGTAIRPGFSYPNSMQNWTEMGSRRIIAAWSSVG